MMRPSSTTQYRVVTSPAPSMMGMTRISRSTTINKSLAYNRAFVYCTPPTLTSCTPVIVKQIFDAAD